MCGISGAIGPRTDNSLDQIVAATMKSQAVRGPDVAVQRTYNVASRRIVLGHNRLKIIDLSSAGDQPMHDSSGRYSIIFNGEIYNYLELKKELSGLGEVFQTESDTEIILVAYRRWGDEAFGRLFGMFALALLDIRTGALILVRDRFGVKPLYYTQQDQRFVFASTAQVMAREFGLAPNLPYLARGLRYKLFDEGEISQYEGVISVPPGSIVRVLPHGSAFQIDTRPFYNLAAAVAARAKEIERRAYQELREEFKSLFNNAIRIRLRSDVPLGVSISGGLDSSTVGAVSLSQRGALIGYSFGNPAATESEGPAVAALAKSLGIEIRYIWPETLSERIDLFWRTLNAQDAPFPSVSVMVQNAVFQRARADGTIVLLGGQAGDEAFMGYRKFFLFYAQSLLRSHGVSALPKIAGTVGPVLGAVIARSRLFWSERGRYFGNRGRDTALSLGAAAPLQMSLPRGSSVRERQMLDITSTSLPSLLRYEDRNSAGNSVESRLPFVDHRLVEFGLALPVNAKLRRGFGKWIVRDAAHGLVPDRIRLNRDKRGFDVNEARWIHQGLGSELRRALKSRWSKIRPFVPSGSTPDGLFNDARLATPGPAFLEAVTLIWLSDRI